MALRLYNTLTRKRELFTPLKKGKVSMYTCGPTVYNYPHIGNYRAYVTSDVLRRYLEGKGIKVNQVMNITDVDDKTIKGSRKAGQKLSEFTKPFTDAFHEDMNSLNILPAHVFPKATEHINDMVAIIKTLLDKGIAYKEKDGSIYYRIVKFKEYGKFAKINVKELQAGASGRTTADGYEKEQVNDFALWKAHTKEDGDVFWETDIGKGRPGWHIECSAMSIKYLGNNFDIHTGGVDLIFPHHQNEIAQSEGATSKKFVNFWVHNEWLLVEGKKMSKSLGNFYTLRDILKKGYGPLAVRYVLMSTHYRQQLNFTFESLEAAKNSLQRLRDFMQKLHEVQGGKHHAAVDKLIKQTKQRFEKEMDNDLEISAALAAIFEFVREINKLMSSMSEKDAENVLAAMNEFDAVLGLSLDQEHAPLPEEIKKLIDEREQARKDKDYKKSDELRKQLQQKGILIEDTPQGTRWKKI